MLERLPSLTTSMKISVVVAEPAFGATNVGADGVDVPFLAYQRPGKLETTGHRMADAFARLHGRQPTFVALEGYDSVIAVATAIEAAGSVEPNDVCEALRRTAIQGTRGEIRFSTEPTGAVHQQWMWPPANVVAFRKLRDSFAHAQSLPAPTEG